MNINDDKKYPAIPHCVSMEDRKKITLTGVRDVDSFDEQTITLVTDFGELSLRGTELHIGKLSTDSGEMTVEGKIDALVYSEDAPRQSGFFGRVFR